LDRIFDAEHEVFFWRVERHPGVLERNRNVVQPAQESLHTASQTQRIRWLGSQRLILLGAFEKLWQATI
jgi:hypothetical protein